MWLLYDEFIYVLREIHDVFPWHIDREKCVRTLPLEGRTYCPITAACALVSQVSFEPESYVVASELLGLDRPTADAIAAAADLAGSYNAHVRADITHALRLGEMWGQEGRWNDPAFWAHPYPHGYDRPMGSGGTFRTSAPIVRRKISSPCTTPPRKRRSPLPPPSIIDETAAVRSIISAWFEGSTERPSPTRPSTGRSGYGNSSEPEGAD